MKKRFISTSRKFSFGAIIAMLIVCFITSAITGFFFRIYCLNTFYDGAANELTEFSDTISMFFQSKENELNIFSSTDAVKNADETIHSFVNEVGQIQILAYDKSRVEEEIRKVCKNFASNDSDIAEIYIGTRWGGYATNFDSSMNGGYDPRKRGWYETANTGRGKVMLTDAFASTVGTTVVGITRSVYDKYNEFIGNSSIEVSLDTLTKILNVVDFGENSFLLLLQKDGTILADTSDTKNNFKKVNDLNISGLTELISSGNTKGSVKINGELYYTYFTTNQRTNYKIVAFSPKKTVLGTFMSTLTITISVCILFSLILGGAVSLLSRQTMKPLKKLIVALRNVADNDFTHKIQVKTQDELGNVAEEFNNTMGTLNNTFSNIRHNTSELDQIGNGLAMDMSNISTEISKITDNIVTISKQSESLSVATLQAANSEKEISQNISKLNEGTATQSSCVEVSKKSAHKMFENISDISKSITNTKDAVNSLVNATNIGKANMQKSSEIAQRIADASGSLQEASSVILNVASQTNLLAMNAAIEASHAGSAGQGFAVVADEIRNLAEQSSKQGKVITQTLKDVSQEIASLASSTKNVESSFSEIFNLSENVSRLTENVKSVIGEHERSCKDVLTAIDEIENVTASVKKESDEIFNASKEVSTAMSNMSGIASTLSTKLGQIESGAKSITKSSEAVNDLTKSNKEKISVLSKEINKFKID